VIGPMPLRPATSAAQVSAAVVPQGVTAPKPVITTRRGATREETILPRG
jgi:hypothetical protein